MWCHLNNYVFWRNGQWSRIAPEKSRMQVIFSGFWLGIFWKCFGMETLKQIKAIKYILTVYNQNDFLDGLNRSSGKSVSIGFHYPSQFLLSTDYKWFTEDRIKRASYLTVSEIQGTELLIRRDKHKQRCMKDGTNYDNLILEAHIKNNGCKAPYQQSFKKFPICSTQKAMKESVYEMTAAKAKYYPVPCKTISNVNVDHTEREEHKEPEESQIGESFTLAVGYTDHIKIITQIQAVDIHAFVGNIGGYIGLFLGRFI